MFKRRFPVKSVRTVAVMVVSSMWHGVHSGYYLSLGSVPFVLMVEDLYAKVMRRNLSDKVNAATFFSIATSYFTDEVAVQQKSS